MQGIVGYGGKSECSSSFDLQTGMDRLYIYFPHHLSDEDRSLNLDIHH